MAKKKELPEIEDLISESQQVAAEFDSEIFIPDSFQSTQQDLSDRQALRRVIGLSTELSDISEAEYRQLRLERVILVGVWTEGSVKDAENSMEELAALAETAGSTVLDALIQRRDKPDPATFIGSGKVSELKSIVKSTGADTVVCDGELSPSQLRNLEDKVKVKVVDRTALILDIFAQHAKSKEGKAQVELAQMSYMLPRLRGWGDSLSRQAGGIGGRGPGETKIEVDRRRIRDKMSKLRREIGDMKVARDTKRQERKRNSIPSVAIAGYTNAGKSSLLNRLTNAGVLVQNALFATLDPTVRRSETSDGRTYTLTDTVGFVKHLPHDLIDAFKSTLEEVSGADVIVHVVDGSHPDPLGQIKAVRGVIADIGGGKIPEIIALNKADIADPEVIAQVLIQEPDAYLISVHSGVGIEKLIRAIESSLPRPRIEIRTVLPYERGDLVSQIHEHGEILSQEYLPEGTSLHAMVDGSLAHALEKYSVN
ncbi:MAG: GTPase HflX [Actinobacteria bacterium]|nr:GTPase HflX [Actinomycetota bacterium]NBP12418.1 GTPase HflX [Actinomycetota bacterium]NBQ00893.1 GTPase HflX [Actinomycetota bacterium]NBQ66578.1 GTPase HflX [Actinomycetota bacterium]NBY50320.1 GTPase HflX [Actinomycetota bacterium]